jgi:hypothetical protein
MFKRASIIVGLIHSAFRNSVLMLQCAYEADGLTALGLQNPSNFFHLFLVLAVAPQIFRALHHGLPDRKAPEGRTANTKVRNLLALHDVTIVAAKAQRGLAVLGRAVQNFETKAHRMLGPFEAK